MLHHTINKTQVCTAAHNLPLLLNYNLDESCNVNVWSNKLGKIKNIISFSSKSWSYQVHQGNKVKIQQTFPIHWKMFSSASKFSKGSFLLSEFLSFYIFIRFFRRIHLYRYYGIIYCILPRSTNGNCALTQKIHGERPAC